MMPIIVFSLLATSFCVLATDSEQINRVEGYYWRDFFGKIPSDAVIGGADINKDSIYIGQALRGPIIIPGEIRQGDREVTFSVYGKVEKSLEGAKILCGSQQNFYWWRTNGSDFNLGIIEKNAVVGGYKEGSGVYYLGRVFFNTGIKIGRILGFDVIKGVRMFFADGNKEHETREFEVLMYKNIEKLSEKTEIDDTILLP